MFKWDDTEIKTIDELLCYAIAAMTENRASEYLAAYEATNERAQENLGYVFGYSDGETRRLLYEAYGVVHPIFGSGSY